MAAKKKTFILVFKANSSDIKDLDMKCNRIATKVSTLDSALKRMAQYPPNTITLFLKEGRDKPVVFRGKAKK